MPTQNFDPGPSSYATFNRSNKPVKNASPPERDRVRIPDEGQHIAARLIEVDLGEALRPDEPKEAAVGGVTRVIKHLTLLDR